MKRIRAVLLLITLLSLAALAYAAIPNQTPEQLQANATDIVVGQVQAIYTKQTVSDQWRSSKGVVELLVDAIEKGESFHKGQIIYVRFWTQAWIGDGHPPPYGTGHELPEEGDVVRAYVKPSKGGLEALLPNGFQIVRTKQ